MQVGLSGSGPAMQGSVGPLSDKAASLTYQRAQRGCARTSLSSSDRADEGHRQASPGDFGAHPLADVLRIQLERKVIGVP